MSRTKLSQGLLCLGITQEFSFIICLIVAGRTPKVWLLKSNLWPWNCATIIKVHTQAQEHVSLSFPYLAIINTICYKILNFQHRYLLLGTPPNSTSAWKVHVFSILQFSRKILCKSSGILVVVYLSAYNF